MVSGRVANHRLNREHRVPVSRTESKELPQHAFVHPIGLHYVPKHVIDDERWIGYDVENEYTFCYTRWGIYPIPNDAIEAV